MGLVVMTVLTALTSTAGGATTVTQWNVTGNGGFVSLDVLNALQLAGGGSEADASSGPVAEAEGTGLCADTAVATNPCPTSATSDASGNALHSTQEAVAHGSGVTATPTGASGCTIPLNAGIIKVDVSCGTASAAEDASGNPTATGTGSLASVSVSLSLSNVLQNFFNIGGLSSVSGICSGVTAANTTGGSNTTGLDPTLTNLLGTANQLLGSVPLVGSSVAAGGDTTGACSIIGGLLNSVSGSSSGAGLGVLSGILNQLLGLTGGNAAAIAPLTINVGGSTTSVSTNGNVVTDYGRRSAPSRSTSSAWPTSRSPRPPPRSRSTAAPASSRRAATQASCPTPSASGAQQFLNLTALTSTLNTLLGQLSSTLDQLTAALSALIGDLINYKTPGNLLNCQVSSPGSTASASVGVLNVGLLTGPHGRHRRQRR